ncbi:MAG: decaprenyl-phosphate phosphoribosyltransferase [Muribaculaceae bacterium]|nr:decaprenyl-phosphate phosphoribosyltransferase [Muribaculaceae bacterium]
MIRALIQLIRPAQWVKNLLVYAPLFFGGRLFDAPCWLAATVVLAAFCAAASGIYCLNDMIDAEADRHHPQKRLRPVASGSIGKPTALAATVILIAAGLLIPLFLPEGVRVPVEIILGTYLLLNITYCLKLKQFAIVDVNCVAIGFELRLLAGGIACAIPLSPWIMVMTYLLALFLALGKRRDDVLIYERQGRREIRHNVTAYNLTFINAALGVLGAIVIVCYLMYCLSADVMERLHTEYLFVTAIFVTAGVLRYLQLAIVESRSGSPTRILLHDRFIRGCILLWIFSFAIILY